MHPFRREEMEHLITEGRIVDGVGENSMRERESQNGFTKHTRPECLWRQQLKKDVWTLWSPAQQSKILDKDHYCHIKGLSPVRDKKDFINNPRLITQIIMFYPIAL